MQQKLSRNLINIRLRLFLRVYLCGGVFIEYISQLYPVAEDFRGNRNGKELIIPSAMKKQAKAGYRRSYFSANTPRHLKVGTLLQATRVNRTSIVGKLHKQKSENRHSPVLCTKNRKP